MQPVQPKITFPKQQLQASACRDHQPGDRAHDVSDHRAQAMLAGTSRKQPVLHREQKHLGYLPAKVDSLVGQQPSAGRVVQVHLAQRPLEGVLLPLLPSMHAHHVRNRKVVSGHDDDGVCRDIAVP